MAVEDEVDDEEDSKLLRCKRAMWVKPWLTEKSLRMQNQLYEEEHSVTFLGIQTKATEPNHLHPTAPECSSAIVLLFST